MKENTRPRRTGGKVRNETKKHKPQKDQEKDATVRDEKAEHASPKDQNTYATQWQGYVSLTLALVLSIACWSYLYAFFRSLINPLDVSRDFGTFVVILWPLVFWVGGPLCAISGIAAFKTNHPPTRWLILLVSFGPPVVLLGFFAYGLLQLDH